MSKTKNTAKDTLEDHEFMCKSGSRVSLCGTHIPFPNLVKKAQAFGNSDNFDFPALPSGEPKD